jgi:hypothetical protein
LPDESQEPSGVKADHTSTNMHLLKKTALLRISHRAKPRDRITAHLEV